MKHHLDGGIRKGALTQEQADAKLATWLEAKDGKVEAKKDGLSTSKADARTKALEAEKKVNENRVAAVKKAEADLIAASEAANAEVATEEATEENNEETQA